MLLPGRTYSSTSAYRYGFNGKEQDSIFGGGNGINYDYGARMYDARVNRFFSVDPLTRNYPWYSPYQFAGDNPIYFIDIDGLEPGVKGTVTEGHPKYTDAELKQVLLQSSASIHSGLSTNYILGVARIEGLSLTLYDKDGDKKRGGNATIGMGTLVHYGSLGNTYYDKDALTKEAQYKKGITFSQAVDMFINETNNQANDLNNRFVEFKIDKSLVSQDEIDVLADIYFNSGTKNTIRAFEALSKNGKQGLIDAIQNGLIGKLKEGTVGSPSESRKNFRLNILKNGNYTDKTTQSAQTSATTTTTASLPKRPVPVSNDIPGVQ